MMQMPWVRDRVRARDRDRVRARVRVRVRVRVSVDPNPNIPNPNPNLVGARVGALGDLGAVGAEVAWRAVALAVQADASLGAVGGAGHLDLGRVGDGDRDRDGDGDGDGDRDGVGVEGEGAGSGRRISTSHASPS